MLTQIAVLTMAVIAIAFYLAAFLGFYSARLTKRNSISTYGTLVGFRHYNTSGQKGYISEDCGENRAGRFPVVECMIDGEALDIAARRGTTSLTAKDLGKRVKIRYRKGFGIVMVIDEGDSLKKHNRLQTILFCVLLTAATIAVILGAAAYALLPGVLDNLQISAAAVRETLFFRHAAAEKFCVLNFK